MGNRSIHWQSHSSWSVDLCVLMLQMTCAPRQSCCYPHSSPWLHMGVEWSAFGLRWPSFTLVLGNVSELYLLRQGGSHYGSSLYFKQSSCLSFLGAIITGMSHNAPVSFCFLLCSSCMTIILDQRYKRPSSHPGTSSTVSEARHPKQSFHTSDLGVSVLTAGY